MKTENVSSSRIFFDVTQLVHWPGKLTGIPRVMQELAVRFSENNERTVFVSWVKEIQEFCAVDLQRTIRERGQGIAYISVSDGNTRSPNLQTTSSGDEVRSVIKQGALRVTKSLLYHGRKFAPAFSERAERKLQYIRLKRLPTVQFEKNDALFIPWGEWWDPNFITKLEALHELQNIRLIQILHDMSPIVVPQFSNSGNAVETYPVYCRRIFPICSLVLSVSENSKRDAISWLKQNKLPIPQIRVFRLGDGVTISAPKLPEDPIFKTSKLRGNDFLLFVGTIELKKNHQLLYYVYKLAKSRGIELPPLVIVGRRGWMTEPTFELMTRDPEIKDKFIFLLDTSDEELSWLYDKCLFSILPSFYEGWGIPIAESVSRGVPCVCSNTSSMTEIAEGYVKHFSPFSTDECLSMIQFLLEPKNLEQAREKAKQYRPFSWDESFEQVDACIKEVL